MKNRLLLILGLFASSLASRGAEVYGGIGVELMKWNDTPYVEISTIYHRSVADKAGLTRYQQILSIEGKSTTDKKKEECEALLRGQVGSTVTLVLLDPRVKTTNTVTLVREGIRVVDESLETVPKSSNDVNRVHLVENQKSLTQLPGERVATNQVLWVATADDGIAGIRFLTGGESGSRTNYMTNWVTYSWNYRATPTSPLSSGTATATQIWLYREEAPGRWAGKGMNRHEETRIKAGSEVDLGFGWEAYKRTVSVSYDAARYRVRVTDLPGKASAVKKED
jgi:hypothetical protein